MDYPILNFGASPRTVIMLTDGSLIKKSHLREDAKKIDLHTLIARIKAFSETSNTSLFIQNCTPTRQSSTWKEHKDSVLAIQNAKDQAIAAAATLRDRLIVHRDNLAHEMESDTSLFALIINIFRSFKLSAYDRCIQDLEIAKRNFQAQNVPTIMPRKYTTAADCQTLLTSNGFNENPELAEFMATQDFRLQEEGEFQSNEEMASFNTIIVKFLEKKYGPAYIVAQEKYGLGSSAFLSLYQFVNSRGTYLGGKSLITGNLFEDIVRTLTTVHHVHTEAEATTLLQLLAFDKYLSKEDVTDFKTYLIDKGVYLETGCAVVTRTDRLLFAIVVQNYFQEKGFYINALDITGKKFAELLVNVKNYQDTPITKARATQLLENLGYEANPLLVKHIVKNQWMIANYAHIQSPEEFQQFNALVLSFLQTVADEHDDTSDVLPALQLEYNANAREYLPSAKFVEAYRFFTAKPISGRGQAHSLLVNLGLYATKDDTQLQTLLKSFEAFLASSGLPIGTNGELVGENIEIFNKLLISFLHTQFIEKSAMAQRLIELQTLYRAQGPTLLDALALINRFRQETPTNLQSEFPVSDFYAQNPESLSQIEKDELSLIAFQYLSQEFPAVGSFILEKKTEFFSTPTELDFTTLRNEISLLAYYFSEETTPSSPTPTQESPPTPPRRARKAKETAMTSVRTLFNRGKALLQRD